MTGLEIFLIWISIGCVALLQRKAKRGKVKETFIVSVLLLLSLGLSLFLFIFPKVTGPTEWMITVFESLHLPTVK